MANTNVITSPDKLSAEHILAFPPKLSHWQQYVAGHLLSRADAYLPERDLLDQVADGKLTAEDLNATDEEQYIWFDDLLGAVNWWRELADAALQADVPAEFGPNPNFAAQRAAFSALLQDVLMAYVQAHQETCAYSDDWGNFGPKMVQFLRCYRLYTRQIESFVMENFPGLNRDLLLNPNFGFVRYHPRTA